MKKMTLSLGLLCLFLAVPSISKAASCSSTLQDDYGRTVQVFHETGYDQYEACSQANYACEDERQWRRSRGDHRRLRCVSRYSGGGYDPYPRGNVSCHVSLRTNYGHVQDRFTGRGVDRRQACRLAMRQCNLQLRRGYGSYGAKCQIDQSGGGYNPDPYDPYDPYPSSCRVGLYRRGGATSVGAGRLLRTFSAHSCGEAMRQCTRAQSYNQLCRRL